MSACRSVSPSCSVHTRWNVPRTCSFVPVVPYLPNVSIFAACSTVISTDTVAVESFSLAASVIHRWRLSKPSRMLSPMASPTTCTVWLS